MFLGILPKTVGVMLFTGLLVEILPAEVTAAWFGSNDLLVALVIALHNIPEEVGIAAPLAALNKKDNSTRPPSCPVLLNRSAPCWACMPLI